jgi:hypothetical protein
VNEAVRAVEPMLRPLIGENVTVRLKLQPGIGQMRADVVMPHVSGIDLAEQTRS